MTVKNPILFWQSQVHLSQAPEIFKAKELPRDAVPVYQIKESIRSFLSDPFGEDPESTYGVEIIANNKVEVMFYTKTTSRDEAIRRGYAWLSNLRYKFIGLDGRVIAKPIKSEFVKGFEGSKLLEIKLPEGLIENRVNILERFINAFYYKTSHTIKLILIWRRDPILFANKEKSNSYNLRFFVSYSSNQYKTKNNSEIEGILHFLVMDIEDTTGKRAFIRELTKVSSLDLLEGKVFKKEYDYLTSVAVEDINLDFPKNLPLPRLPILEYENIRYIDINNDFKKKSIKIGCHIKEGIITGHETYVPIKKLPQDVVIFGKSGSGKTYFLARFIQELCEKAKDVGILILNVAKSSQEIFYRDFEVIKYSDDDFCIPYFIEGPSLEKSLQETATYICASLGLKNVFEKIIYRTEMAFMKKNGELPEFLNTLLRAVENYVRNNPYGSEVQANLLQALRNRIKIFTEPKVQKVLQLSKNLPKWIDDWMGGKKIFLDLSMCNKFTKQIVVNAIFQFVRTVTKDIEVEELKQIIVIDEAHAILEKPITRNSDDTDFIMKEQMVKIFSELLKEYRSRGVGFIIADQSPSRLFDDVASQPSIKVLFRQDYPNNILFSENPLERQMLTRFENRLAVVINGATGENYLIKTIDWFFKN
jgi:hypothetical protein